MTEKQWQAMCAIALALRELVKERGMVAEVHGDYAGANRISILYNTLLEDMNSAQKERDAANYQPGIEKI